MSAVVRGLALGVTPTAAADPDPLVCRNARAAGYLPTCGEPTDQHCPTCAGCPDDCDCPDFAPNTFTAAN